MDRVKLSVRKLCRFMLTVFIYTQVYLFDPSENCSHCNQYSVNFEFSLERTVPRSSDVGDYNVCGDRHIDDTAGYKRAVFANTNLYTVKP